MSNNGIVNKIVSKYGVDGPNNSYKGYVIYTNGKYLKVDNDNLLFSDNYNIISPSDYEMIISNKLLNSLDNNYTLLIVVDSSK